MINNKEPLVSIILPTYNRVNLLIKAVSGVLEQSYKNWELLIIDDASTDETEVKMNEISKLDSRVRYIRIENWLDLITCITCYLRTYFIYGKCV